MTPEIRLISFSLLPILKVLPKESFLKMNEAGVAQVRIVPAVGAEQFAKFIYDKVNTFIFPETEGRVKVTKVEFREHAKNSAIYIG